MKLNFFISMPSVLVDGIIFTGLQLYFFNVVVTSKCEYMTAFHSHSWEERLFLQHITSMFNVFIDILQTIVAHSSHQKPASNVLIHLLSYQLCPSGTSIHINKSKVARKLSLILCNQPPLRKLFSLRSFNKQSSNFITSKFPLFLSQINKLRKICLYP